MNSLNSPILIMVTLVGAAVTITHTVDGIEKDLDKKQAVLAKETEKQLAVQAKETEKQLAVQAKETEICELRAQNDLRRCLMDMGYGSEYASWREKMLGKKLKICRGLKVHPGVDSIVTPPDSCLNHSLKITM